MIVKEYCGGGVLVKKAMRSYFKKYPNMFQAGRVALCQALGRCGDRPHFWLSGWCGDRPSFLEVSGLLKPLLLVDSRHSPLCAPENSSPQFGHCEGQTDKGGVMSVLVWEVNSRHFWNRWT